MSSSDASTADLVSHPYKDISHIPKEELRICVAEDNLVNQRIMQKVAQKFGWPEPTMYENGQAALDGIRQNAREGKPFHVVFMDIAMPVMDGFTATRNIREDSDDAVRNVLIIAVAVDSYTGRGLREREKGMNDILFKPIRPEKFQELMETYTMPEPTNAPATNGNSRT